jgi:hypothetical protein
MSSVLGEKGDGREFNQGKAILGMITREWLDVAIENWCRWHWSAMRRHKGQCKSLEAKYRSPQPWDAPPITPLGKVDILGAMAIEDAWKTLPFVPKIVLKQWFVLRRRSGVICRSLRSKGFPVVDRDFELEIARAKIMLAGALAEVKKKADNYKVAATCEREARLGGCPVLEAA